MKVCRVGFILLTASLFSASAQISVEVTQDQEYFLPGESLPVAVRITNLSGRDLHLGADDDWLTFNVESRDSSVVAKQGEVPVAGEFVVESSQVATKRLDLAPYFEFTHAGHYSIVATLRIKEWSREVTSRPKGFDLIEGAKLWEQDVGVPPAPGSTNSALEVRKYILQQANYIRGQIRLYLRVTDPYGKTFRVFPIGAMVSFGRPEHEVDRRSNLHVLYQNGPFSSIYVQFNVDGDIILRQAFDIVDRRPRLQMDDDGNISVRGGARRLSPNDLPPPTEEELSQQAAKLAQALNPTNSVPAADDKKKKKS